MSTAMPLSAGTHLGSFDIVSLIGAGGMGEVYRAYDERLDRIVAVKVLRPDKIGNLERFRREARFVSRLSHPHICSIYEAGEEDGTPFFVMEYLAGQTLAERLDDGAIPLPEALRYAVEISEALTEAHRHGVIHRDIKPGNVMLTREGVKLLDFGLAKLKELQADDRSEQADTLQRTDDGAVVGTVSYMSPEQLEGRKVDTRSDLFAVGAVLYEMVTGRKAFAGSSRAGVTAAILTSDPPPMSTLHPIAPPALERLVARCLAKHPDDRWQTASDLAGELHDIAETRRIDDSLHNRRSRRALIRGGIAGATLVAAGSASLFFLYPGDRSQPSYDRVTFRRGIVSAARFGPDGQTIIYSAAWEGRPYDLFLARVGSAESRPLGVPSGRILSVSRKGDLAVLLGTQTFAWGVGTLARVSVAGGVPRELVDSVTEADWGPDDNLAIVRRQDGRMRIEFPVGNPLYEAPSIWSMRVSPKGDRIAFFESQGAWLSVTGQLLMVDRARRTTTLARGVVALGLAWTPKGDQVWFTAARADGPPALRAVSLSGKERIVERVPAPLMLDDIATDGRVLLTKGLNLGGITCLLPGESTERDVGWLSDSRVEALSADARTILFGAMEGNWLRGAYIRGPGGLPAVRLGDGHPESLSPDGKWVLVRAPGAPNDWGIEWMLVPTGAGAPRRLPRGDIAQLREGAWLPDGERILFTALAKGGAVRAYVQDVSTGEMRPITPDGVYMPEKAATPDGKSVLVSLGGQWWLYPVDSGTRRAVPAIGVDDSPIQWSADGRFRYVRYARDSTRVPIQIERVDVTSGRRKPCRTIVPSDPVGIDRVDSLVITPDARGYCYSYARRLQELYVADGLK
jgi:eukaryotic-like serine/threonine-protein kinase